MKYDFNQITNRKNTSSMKWDHKYIMDIRANDDVLPLWVADMEFKVADEIINELLIRVNHGIFGYTIPTDEYYNAVISWYKKRFNWIIEKNSIMYAPSLVTAISLIIDATTKKGDGIIIQPPVYYPFENIIKNHNRQLINNNLINSDGYYTIDFNDLRNKATNPDNKLMILCTPHNPVGRVWSSDELLQVALICKETNTILIADEIHCDIVRKTTKHYPIMSLVEDTNNIISITAPSKTFNLAGLQMSIVVINDYELRNKYYEIAVNQYAIKYFPTLGLTGATAAYNYGETWLNEVLEYIDNNLEYMKKYIDANLPNAKFTIPEGTYLTWLNLSAYGDSDKIMEKLIVNGNLLIENGKIFGDIGNGYFRINVACSRIQLKKCLDIIVDTVINYK